MGSGRERKQNKKKVTGASLVSTKSNKTRVTAELTGPALLETLLCWIEDATWGLNNNWWLVATTTVYVTITVAKPPCGTCRSNCCCCCCFPRLLALKHEDTLTFTKVCIALKLVFFFKHLVCFARTNPLANFVTHSETLLLCCETKIH